MTSRQIALATALAALVGACASAEDDPLDTSRGVTYESHLARSKDLVGWESSPRNPVMQFSPEDKRIANPKLTADQRERIAKAVNLNNSDVDFCEFDGKVIIYYSWGNQRGIEHLAEAVYEGTLESFLQGFFPTGNNED